MGPPRSLWGALHPFGGFRGGPGATPTKSLLTLPIVRASLGVGTRRAPARGS